MLHEYRIPNDEKSIMVVNFRFIILHLGKTFL